MGMDPHDNIKEIINLARAGEARVIEVGDPLNNEFSVPVAIVPDAEGGAAIIALDKILEPWRARPRRVKGVATAHTLDDFIALFNYHKLEASASFANIVDSQPYIIGVIDYHDGEEPAFCEHRIKYAFPVSPEWALWRGKNGVIMSQEDFAEFIEANIANLASTDESEAGFADMFGTQFARPAEILELSRGLEISAQLNVKEVRNLPNGTAQIVYDEVHKDGSGKPLVVPGLFVINIPLFIGGQATRLIARLRYKRTSQGIKWAYHLWRWQEAVREALLIDVATVKDKTERPCYEGLPEA
jgi:uncharacterized protein YfdQ (DUF2303 family)